MALLPEPRLRVTTAAGVPVSGGKLRLYNQGTTNLTSVFSDATLATPLANPIVAASDGYLPQFFAAEGTVVTGAFLDASNVEITGQAFVSAVFVGQNTGTIERDFTNSRVTISGAAGIVSIEAGDPSPDEIGGKLRLGGRAGTQADTISLDAATTNTTGLLTVNGKKLSGVVATAATTFSAVSTIDIALPQTLTGTRAWKVTIFDIITPASPGNNNFSVRLAYDSVPTFKSGAADYAYSHIGYDVGVPGVSESRSAGASSGLLNGNANMLTTTGKPARIELDIITPASGTDPTVIETRIMGYNQAGTPMPYRATGVMLGLGGYGTATYLRIILSAGTVSGKYRVEALRGYGE